MKYKLTGSFFILALLLWLSCASLAQQQTQTVILHVRVTNPDDKAVLDVPQESFQVTEDGVPQKIAFFINKEVPLSYGLVIDGSGSMRSQINEILGAAGRIVSSNRPSDETFVVRFVSTDKIYVQQEPTSNKTALFKALDQFYIEGGLSAVVDAIYLSAQKLAELKDTGQLRRRILILVTDGEDRVSFYKQDKLFELLGENNIQVFTIALTNELKPSSRDKAMKLLTRLALDTGGRTYFPDSKTDIERVAAEIINDIRMQYVIGYEPTADDTRKDFHKVLVTITENPNQEKRVAITRVGYQSRKK
ncbi:MAG TPA: VWA domain-containing protein [Pyrinomonadaceae bacterium]|jgi:Ca-activated chloride channel family protein|nr:VWA domain-containing protein [Pyrinomonadaceae bacterium]